MANILRRCGGLLVALGVAGKGIRAVARRKERDGVEKRKSDLDAMVEYSEKLERSFRNQADLGEKMYGEHDGLFGSLETSLKSGTEV